MATRNNLYQQDKTKKLIQATQLINRLVAHAQGEIELSATQIQAAKIVIGKTIPDLKSVELTGAEGGPVEAVVRWAAEK